jgi:nitroreductase
MDIEALERLIKSRRSIRKWKKEMVPDGLLMKAIELGTWAPNGGNFQIWHFVVVKNPKVIEKMAQSVQSMTDKIASWPEAQKWPEETKRFQQNASFFRNAPVCIGVFTREYQSLADKVLLAREPSDKEAQQIFASRRSSPTSVQSVAAAVTTMLLVLHQMGLGAVWLAGPLTAKAEIEKILEVPSGTNLACLVAVGYPDESPQKDRKPVKEVAKFID